MGLEKRFMSRSNWPRVIDKEYVHMMSDENDFDGAVGLIYIKKAIKLAVKTYGKTQVTIIKDVLYGGKTLNCLDTTDIILMHDHEDTTELFYKIINRYIEKGFEFLEIE